MTRRALLPLFALLLALLTGAGAALPSPGLWQCRHAAQIVAAPSASRQAMPCRMGEQMIAGAMACCRAKALSHAPGGRGAPALSSSGCHPTFVPLTAFSAVRIAQPPLTLVSDSRAVHALPTRGNGTILFPLALPSRRRSPPGGSLPLSPLRPASSPRAPPVA